MADSAFTEWFKNKGSEWIEKASNLFKDDDTEESEKKKKYLEFSEKEKAKKELDTEVGEYKTLDTEGQVEYEAAAVIKARELIEKGKLEEEESDKELKKKLDGIKEVIDTFENFTTGVPLDVPEWEGDIADPYAGAGALSDLQQKENQKALLAQITGYTSPMQRAVDLEKRLTNLVRYT
tara:strand:+ start:178 stop:714 length:537 start_codon:yes stop_codon:yes gene_type:complete